GMVGDCVLSRTVADTAAALAAMAGYEPGDRRVAERLPEPLSAATHGQPGTLRVRVCVDAPFGIPVDDEPLAAARATAEALRQLGETVEPETSAPWDDESFPGAWSTFMTGTGQHLVRVAERLHGRHVAPELLEPATRAWLVDSAPVTLVDYLEAG